MSDAVQRFLLEDLDIRGAVVQLESCWQAIRTGRNAPPAVDSLLGQMCGVTAIISANLKQAGRLTFQLSGHGPVSMLVIDCSQALNLRGYARHADTGAATNLRDLLGDGRLMMTLDVESAREPWQSMVPVEADSIAGVFEHYLAQSEQQPAVLMLAANGERVGGLFLQKLPGADMKDADGWNRVEQLARTLKDEELLGLPAEDLLTRLFHEENVRVFSPQPVKHDFPPQPEKIADMLRSLGQAEIERILSEQGEIHVRDDLSNHDYRLSSDEARALFRDGPTLH